MWPYRLSGIAAKGNYITPLYFLSRNHFGFGKVGVSGQVAIAVVYNNFVSIAAIAKVNRFNNAIAGYVYLGSNRAGKVHSLVKLLNFIYRVNPPSITTGHTF